MFGSKDLLFSAEKYGVAKSLRFRSSASAYLSRTPASAGNRKTWTWSGWVKRGTLGVNQMLISTNGSSDTTFTSLRFDTDDKLWVGVYSTGSVLATTQVFRDPSSWYHLVWLFDTTQATAANRCRIFINGTEVTSFSTDARSTYFAQNTDYGINSTQQHAIGRNNVGASLYVDCYLAEVNFIDGQALTPSSFGFYDNNGIWQPKGYTGTYGTNGFYLKFTDVGATSGANSGYGKDFSGFNTNYWTTNNFNSTSTSTSYDSMYDSPVNASNGITGIGNYAVLNPLNKGASLTISDGNLYADATTTTVASTYSTLRIDTAAYWENYINTTDAAGYPLIGCGTGLSTGGVTGAGSWSVGSDGYTYLNGAATNAGYTFIATDIIQCAYDPVTGKFWLGKNNTWFGSGNPATGANPTATISTTNQIYALVSNYGNSNSTANFGQRPFAYTPPSGFSALNTQNLSTPTITNGAAYMAAVTYTGSASTQNVTATSTNSGNNPNAVTFQPDLVWIKDRSNAQDHKWTDVVRGATKALESNTTDDEATDSNGVTAFNNNGFSLGTGTRAYSDSNGDSYIAWEWKENVSSGFDIVTYTGNGSARTISHSLNAVPNMIIVKARTTASTDQGWPVYHSANTSAPETDYLMLNTTAATADLDTVWNDTAPTSAVFSVGTNANVNANNDTYVAYLWAAIAEYSAFGSYAGNSSADGPFVYTGFRPRWIMIKITTLGGSAGYDWYIFDTSRDTYNAADLKIVANSSVIENQNSGGSSMAGFPIDILSNGFKIRNSGGNWNASSNTYIYAAFAENPFKISRAR